MKRLSPTGRRWLVGVHSLMAAVWVGAAFSMMLLSFIPGATPDGDDLNAVNAAVKLLDDWLIIPSALGCLLTGALISTFTHWGFFRFRWVTVKLVLTVAFVLFGTFFLGPWTNEMSLITRFENATAWHNPVYLHDRWMSLVFGSAQAGLLAATLFITALRPWSKKTSQGAGRPPQEDS